MPASDVLSAAMADLERRVRGGSEPSRLELETLYPDAWRDSETAIELAYAEYALRRARGEVPDRGAWLRAYPDWAERLERLFGLYDLMTDRDTSVARADRTRPGRADEPVPAMELPGYRVHEELGRGGMAVVYRATHLALNRPVALKVLRGGAWGNEADLERFRREAETVAKLRHANVVPIYEAGEGDDGPYLALEYVSGGTLADELKRRTTPFPHHLAAGLAETLARATHAAHAEGVIHRDLKPANVLLAGPASDPLSVPKISDFGLAVDTNASARASLVHSLTLSGTPSYMAPEQAAADRGAIGPRTDVYSLGAILYELLTGRPPHEGPTVLDTLDRVRSDEPVPPRSVRPDVPRDLDTVCLKALAKDPGRRYGSAGAFADDLRNVLDGRPVAARPVRWPERAWMAVRRRPVVSGLAASFLIATAAAVGLYDAKARQAIVNDRENARLADEARVAETMSAARTHWTTGRLPDARAALESLDERLRTEGWRELHRLSSAVVGSFDLPPQWAGLRLYPYSASENGRYVLLGPSGMAGTQCHLVEVKTGTMSKGQGLLSFIELAAMGRGHSVITIPALNFAGIYQNERKKPPEPIIKYWDLATDKAIAYFKVEPRSLVPSENGLYALQPIPQKPATLYDVAAGRAVASLPIPGTSGTRQFLRVGPGGRHVILVDSFRWTVYPTTDPNRPFPIIHTDDTEARFEALAPDNRTLFWTEIKRYSVRGVTTGATTLVAYDLDTQTALFRRPIEAFPQNLVLSPDGRWFVVARGEAVAVYATKDGSPVVTLNGHPDYPKTLAFSRDGRMLFTKSKFSLKVWDLSPWIAKNSGNGS